jgi:A/G-specific adenine glycosylase
MKKHKDAEQAFRDRLKEAGISASTIRLFRKIIYGHYREHFREMPWRRTRNPYRIFISEVMLQQTQVERVGRKYGEFIRAFPDFSALAKASLSEVLGVWQGMGYNRRAISLKKAAEIIMDDFGGRLPADPDLLRRLPGIGQYSAPAIYTFVTGRPSLFIETNIRRVYIHFFFDDRIDVRDDEIMPVLARTLDKTNPREWYYALMDYGVRLKKEGKNPNRRSAHYQKQPAFHGSTRQMRGMVLRTLLQEPDMTEASLRKKLPAAVVAVDRILEGLIKEGFVKKTGGKFRIP